MAFLDRFSLDDLERYSVWCRWALRIPAFIIVLLTFVSHKISDRILVLQGAGKAKSQERQKLTEQQLAKARAQAEQANDRAQELEAKQRPRTVTAEQDAALRAAIHRLFASGLHVPINNRSKMLDPESENYTHQIAAALPRFRRRHRLSLRQVFSHFRARPHRRHPCCIKLNAFHWVR